MQQGRNGLELTFEFANGATDSQVVDIEQGAFGTILVPAGSALIGKALQFVAVPRTSGKFAETALLSTSKALVAGANALTADEIREVGAASSVRMRVDTAVGSASSCVLLWKA